MLKSETHNKKSLAARYGMSYKSFRKQFSIMLRDADFRQRFGQYCYPFTPKQLNLIIEELGEPPIKN